MSDKKGKAVFSSLTMADISNPYRRIPRKKLLRLAGSRDISNNHRVITLPDGKIRVEEKTD